MTDSSSQGATAQEAWFAERYAMAAYPSGGVVVDLQSGNYYRLNTSAERICSFLREHARPVDSVAEEFKVSRAEAARILDDVVSVLETPSVRGVPQGSYHFYPAENGYVLRHSNRDVLVVDVRANQVHVPSGLSITEEQLELYLRALGPKLLFQQGVTVLHASACFVGERLLAFAGLSGAGKTTTIRAFQAAGATVVSEDLVILKPGEPEPIVLLEGEKDVHGWARSAADAMTKAPGKPVDVATLFVESLGSVARLERITFLDRMRRRGTEFEVEPMDGPDALVEVMAHDFLGAKDVGEWRRYFSSAQWLVATMSLGRGWAPDGTTGLSAAASRYMSTIAS